MLEPAPTRSDGGIWVGVQGLRKYQIERNGDRKHRADSGDFQLTLRSHKFTSEPAYIQK